MDGRHRPNSDMAHASAYGNNCTHLRGRMEDIGGGQER